jgi:rubrerythrin
MEYNLSPEELRRIEKAERNEIHAYKVYQRLAQRFLKRHPDTAKALITMSEDEKKHYDTLAKITKKQFRGHLGKSALVLFWMGPKILLGHRAHRETEDIDFYTEYQSKIPELKDILFDEKKHLYEIQSILNESKTH